jgi:hypothetical protein
MRASDENAPLWFDAAHDTWLAVMAREMAVGVWNAMPLEEKNPIMSIATAVVAVVILMMILLGRFIMSYLLVVFENDGNEIVGEGDWHFRRLT